MSTSPLHVIVVGGGIAGLGLAQALRQARISVTAYERDRTRTDRLEGFRLHINPAGSRALHACLPPAVWNDFVATADESRDLGFLTEQLEELLVVQDRSQLHITPESERSYAADRVTLRRLLLTGLDDVVQFDKEFVHYESTPDGRVTAYFEDGTTAAGDLLVGADGAGSRVRQQYLPQAERIDTGALSVAWKLPLTDSTRAWLPPRLGTSMNMVVAPVPYCLFTSAFDPEVPAPTSGRYVLCAFISRREAYPRRVEELPVDQLRPVVEEMIAGWHPILRRMLAEADPDSFMLVRHTASAPVSASRIGNVSLIGDAAHNMPPVGGLGANTALRDASLLGRKLVDVDRGRSELRVALGQYEAEMREYGSAAVHTAIQTQNQGLASGRLTVEGQKLWFWLSRVAPWLGGMETPFTEWARPLPWELEPAPWEQGIQTDGAREEAA